MKLFLRIIVFIILGVAAMSSQSEEGQLVIPAGNCKGCVISAEKLGEEIVGQLTMVERVYNFSFPQVDPRMGRSVDFTASFTVETGSGDVYHNIQCEVNVFFDDELTFEACENNEVVFEYDIEVNISDIILVDTREPDPVDSRERIH